MSMHAQSPNQSNRFANLDAVRSLACLLVLSSHILFEYVLQHFPGSFLATNRFAVFMLGNGGLGVQVFFGLSGFLITHLLLKELQQNGTINVPHFYVRRVLRIWPVYFTVVVFVFVVYVGAKAAAGLDSRIHESLLMSVLFLSNYDLIRILLDSSAYANGMLSLTWSVSVEEQFYLVWPALLLTIGYKRLGFALPLLIVSAIAFSAYYGTKSEIVYHHTLSNVMFLGAGGLLAYLRMNSDSFRRLLNSLSRSAWALVMVVFMMPLVWFNPVVKGTGAWLTLYMATTAAAIFAFLAHQTSVAPETGLARWNPLVRMAKYTYGLYMYHRIAGFMVNTIILKIWGLPQTPEVGALLALSNLGLACLLSIASYHLMEAPLLALKTRFEPHVQIART